jgi:hypothetical protein
VRSIGSFRICGPAKKGVSRSALPHACVHLQYRGRRTSPIDVLGRSAFSRAAQGSDRRHPRSFCTLLARNASVDQNIHASITYIYSAAGWHTIIDQSDRDDEQAVQGSIGVLLLLVDAASNTSRSTHLTWMRAVTPRGQGRAGVSQQQSCADAGPMPCVPLGLPTPELSLRCADHSLLPCSRQRRCRCWSWANWSFVVWWSLQAAAKRPRFSSSFIFKQKPPPACANQRTTVLKYKGARPRQLEHVQTTVLLSY